MSASTDRAAERLHRYRSAGVDLDDLDADPLVSFRAWMHEAVEEGCAQPEAMAVATVGTDGSPAVRNVLSRGLDERGLVFFTNERSPKGRALFAEPRCEALFSWLELDRQVRASGRASTIDPQESDAYFARRPRRSQLAAHASRQSEVLSGRGELEERVLALEARYEGLEVPRPAHWGGFRIAVRRWELWQGRDGRMHDRFRYTADGHGWRLERLSP